MTEKPRPLVRCIIARKLANGGIGKSRVVPLYIGWMAMKANTWFVVGPDPEDMAALATWERDQEPKEPEAFNPPRVP